MARASASQDRSGGGRSDGARDWSHKSRREDGAGTSGDTEIDLVNEPSPELGFRVAHDFPPPPAVPEKTCRDLVVDRDQEAESQNCGAKNIHGKSGRTFGVQGSLPVDETIYSGFGQRRVGSQTLEVRSQNLPCSMR